MTHKFPPSVGPSPVGKPIVAGHVRAGAVRGSDDYSAFYDGEGHWLIDGGVEFTERLNVLTYHVRQARWERWQTPYAPPTS
ncbi:MAG: hypothetical protein QM621_03005 [Aeromicrobium sp.]|uniref:hypothetical protein n=1 Tax=Aeromicrobium sp. TaxID=1871063 RepID=UPI0039E710EA